MATVYFKPSAAVRYMGRKQKEFPLSLARPRPKLRLGDIVIVDRATAYKLTKKGFGEFEQVESIDFVKKEAEEYLHTLEMEAKVEALTEENERLAAQNEELTKALNAMKTESQSESDAQPDAGA